MKAFKCGNCGNVSYSSADIDHQTDPRCTCCGHDMRNDKAQSKKTVIKELFKREDTCVMCGSYVPEGRMVCTECENIAKV
ncbi:MAG: hypothetical protein K9L62_00315 [Vallitaleaceae bacterium]|nr:hypothetical protein [Vallitaleaceae bacterium]